MRDDRLRNHLRDLEQQSQPDPGFRDALFADLDQRMHTPRPGRTRRPKIWMLAAALGGVALVGGAVAGTLAGLVPTLQRGSGTPMPTVAITSSATPSASVAAISGASPSPSPTLSPAMTASPTLSPSPISSPTPVPTPSYGLAGVWQGLADTPALPSVRVADFIPGPGDRLYAFLWGSSTNDVLVYTPSNDTWQLRRPATTLPYGVGTGEPMVAGRDGLIYAFAGGPEFTDVFAYNPAANSWTTSRITQIPNRWIADAAAGPDGTIYLLPVCCSDGVHLLTFDPATRAVNELGSQPWAVNVMAVDSNGLVIMAGQEGVGTYDPTTKLWVWFASPSPNSLLYNPVVTAGMDRLYAVERGRYSEWEIERGWDSVQPPSTSDAPEAATWFGDRLYTLTVDPAISGASPGRLHLLRFAPAR